MRVWIGRTRDANPEENWDKPSGGGGSGRVGWVLAGVLLLVVTGMALMLSKDGGKDETGRTEAIDELQVGLETAEEVARAFLAESDPAKRLQWVRNADEVNTRLAEYPLEARSEVGEIEEVLGHQVDEGRSVTGFVVAFPSGNVRLLEVVGTPDGPRVDWDAYARHCTVRWENFWHGIERQAVVRVFCEPATERPEPFDDPQEWTCFRMSSPDMPHAVLGFAPVGSVREERMKQVILGTPNYRQRFTLEIVRHDGEGEPLFEISRCLAVGWIVGERTVEQDWELEQ